MSAVAKAVWFIESHFAGDVSLDDIAAHSGVSRSHMSRTFPLATGQSISGYLRGRRLTEAARALAADAPDILPVALDAGYSSHEAFTRAFRDQFGLTPEEVRAQAHLENLKLVEPIRMDNPTVANIARPRFVDGKPMLIAGLIERHAFCKPEAIPAQWQRFAPYIGNIPGQVGRVAYGVLSDMFYGSESFQCLAGVEVSDLADLPEELGAVRIPAQRYAVFRHEGHISTIRSTIHSIFSAWLPQSGYEAGDFPNFIERYGESFNPGTGLGEIEIWVPMKGQAPA